MSTVDAEIDALVESADELARSAAALRISARSACRVIATLVEDIAARILGDVAGLGESSVRVLAATQPEAGMAIRVVHDVAQHAAVSSLSVAPQTPTHLVERLRVAVANVVGPPISDPAGEDTATPDVNSGAGEITVVMARTKMRGDRRCIGALTQGKTNVRLFNHRGDYFNATDRWRTGQRWNLDLEPPLRAPIAPHVEDKRCTGGRLVDEMDQADLIAFVHEHAPNGIARSIDELYEGLLTAQNGKLFLEEGEKIPAYSVQFCELDQPLHRITSYGAWRYQDRHRGLSVPFVDDTDDVPGYASAGQLVRFSLARWWDGSSSSNGFQPQFLRRRSYVQLSAIY